VAPSQPKIYHIVHVDRLPSIVKDGHLWCDAEIVRHNPGGTSIGMNHIKQRRLHQLRLASYPGLHVGDCVPFYFCPRSVMLFIIHKQNYEDLSYHGGQKFIVHLEADLLRATGWAEKNSRRWAFTLSNAGAIYFEDRCNLSQLHEIDWTAVQTNDWRGSQKKEGKQAEFLMEYCFPWELVERIGIHSEEMYQQVTNAFTQDCHCPAVDIKSEWYY
jgi:hypothetical protein